MIASRQLPGGRAGSSEGVRGAATAPSPPVAYKCLPISWCFLYCSDLTFFFIFFSFFLSSFPSYLFLSWYLLSLPPHPPDKRRWAVHRRPARCTEQLRRNWASRDRWQGSAVWLLIESAWGGGGRRNRVTLLSSFLPTSSQ